MLQKGVDNKQWEDLTREGDNVWYVTEHTHLQGRTQVVKIEHRALKDEKDNCVVYITSKACELSKIKAGRASSGLQNLLKLNFTETTNVCFYALDEENQMIVAKATLFMKYFDQDLLEFTIGQTGNFADWLEKEKYGDEDEES
eukprot:CAMPEP_0194059984 /NCGR_PEP_ID=MMETSP0009_2-20130614/70543_1 /TAXON_ID=210454 /ORGANISM="Grammatophora oceanica, Strain CCMP 410" /LENGTH=142 /DNA_ID=CAMNT_0038710751 /DNA_START=17 /DNA_END=443 /DNA_ORIENTATION=-